MALIALCVFGWIAESTPAAHAASLRTLQPTLVTPTSAVLHGTIDTGGLATRWRFVYGTTSAYGESTPLLTIPAGIGADYVLTYITGLRPNTPYHYRLTATIGLIVNYAESLRGTDIRFTTKPVGQLALLDDSLLATGDTVSIPLRCRSAVRCAGRFTLAENPSPPGRPSRPGRTCSAGAFTIPAGRARVIDAGLRQACRSLLGRAVHHRISAELTAITGTGQTGVNRMISLALG